jgi:hypothetical protein
MNLARYRATMRVPLLLLAVLLAGATPAVRAECTCPQPCDPPSFCVKCFCYTPLPPGDA